VAPHQKNKSNFALQYCDVEMITRAAEPFNVLQNRSTRLRHAQSISKKKAALGTSSQI
jgi:hypothetical protein